MSKAKRTPAGEKGTADRIEADDGGFWVRLTTKQALDREGVCMRHCIGDGEYDLYAGDEDIASGIWSLRDRTGLSRLTVQVLLCQIEDAYGPDNHDISKWSALQIRHLIAAYAAAGHCLMADIYPYILIAPDGRTFRHDRVPADVRKAIAAAEREEQIVAAAREVIGISRLMKLMGVYPGGASDPHAT